MAKRKVEQISAPGEQRNAADSDISITAGTTGSQQIDQDTNLAPAKKLKHKQSSIIEIDSIYEKQTDELSSDVIDLAALSPADSGLGRSFSSAGKEVSPQPTPPTLDQNEDVPTDTLAIELTSSSSAIKREELGAGKTESENPTYYQGRNEEAKGIYPKGKRAAIAKNGPRPKAPRKIIAKKTVSQSSSEPPKPKRINKALKNKVEQINDFLRAKHDSTLTKDPANCEHVIVPESLLLGALMAMHVDWGMSEDAGGMRATLLDARDVIEDSFTRPTGTLQLPVQHHVVDLSRQSMFEQGIKIKVRGHLDSEDANLLAIQLELNQQRTDSAMVETLVRHMIAACEGDTEGDPGDGEDRDDPTETGVEDPSPEYSPHKGFSIAFVDAEQNRRGVCPAPRA